MPLLRHWQQLDAASHPSNLPNFESKPDVVDLAFGASDDVLATRYNLKLEQTIGDKPVQSLAPWLSVFRRHGAVWLIAAHANFAQIG